MYNINNILQWDQTDYGKNLVLLNNLTPFLVVLRSFLRHYFNRLARTFKNPRHAEYHSVYPLQYKPMSSLSWETLSSLVPMFVSYISTKRSRVRRGRTLGLLGGISPPKIEFTQSSSSIYIHIFFTYKYFQLRPLREANWHCASPKWGRWSWGMQLWNFCVKITG